MELLTIIIWVLKSPFIILNLIFRAIFRLDTKESIQAAHLANLAEIRKTSRIHMIEEETAEKARVEAEKIKVEAERVKAEEIKSKIGGVKNGVISSLDEEDVDLCNSFQDDPFLIDLNDDFNVYSRGVWDD